MGTIEEQRTLAFKAPMTGLTNRSLLEDRQWHAMAPNRRSGRLSAVCYLDLDGLEAVYGFFGHQAGDMVLPTLTRMSSVSTGPL
jgi:diguanylate cyclase (GGDEF)-like protein